MGIFLAHIRRRLSSRLRFCVFWEAGRDRVFLVSEPVRHKTDLILTGNLKQVIVTLQYTYAIHMMILTPFGIDRLPFLISISLFRWYPWSNYFSRAIWVPSWFLSSFRSIFLILSPKFGHSMLKPVAEIRARSGSVVDAWCYERDVIFLKYMS